MAKKAKKPEPAGKREPWWKRLPWDNRKWTQLFHALQAMFIAAILWNAHELFRRAIGEEFGGPFGRYATGLISLLFNFLYFKFGFVDVLVIFFPSLAEKWSVWRKDRTDENQ